MKTTRFYGNTKSGTFLWKDSKKWLKGNVSLAITKDGSRHSNVITCIGFPSILELQTIFCFVIQLMMFQLTEKGWFKVRLSSGNSAPKQRCCHSCTAAEVLPIFKVNWCHISKLFPLSPTFLQDKYSIYVKSIFGSDSLLSLLSEIFEVNLCPTSKLPPPTFNIRLFTQFYPFE